MSYTLQKIAKIIDAKPVGNTSGFIQQLVIDSRNVVSSTNSLFFAIRGERHDGHRFIDELYNKGFENFVVEEIPHSISEFPKANFLLVKNSLKALQQLAAFHRTKFNYPVIGITGSNGKTIVKEWLFHVLQGDKKVIRSPKSYNSQVGVPLSVWLMDNSFDLAVFEAGISFSGEMEKLEKIIQPTIGIITNIGEPHQENFNSYEEKAKEKLKLFINSEILIYCSDIELIDNLIKNDHFLFQKKLFRWSEKGDGDLSIISKKILDDKTEIEYKHNYKTYSLIIPFTDNASVTDAIYVLATQCAMSYSPEVFHHKFETLPPVAMRMELKKGVNNCSVINDSYNSDIVSLQIALNYLSQQNQHTRKTLILSDILQSGKAESELYSEVSGLISEFKIDRIIGIGEAIIRQKDLFKTKEKSFYTSTDDFLHKLDLNYFNNEAILLKGSRNFYFEKISAAFEEKMHRTVLEINLNALVHNLNYFRSKLKPKTKIMIMVKALSYGSGTYEIANILQYQRVDYLGVAFADEGVALREAGIKTPIIVMNPEQNSFDLILKYKLEPEIYNFKVLEHLSKTVLREGLSNYPVHIKFDTGMYRLGFTETEITRLIQHIRESKALKVSSVFSHLAASDENVHDEYTRQQITLFNDLSRQMINGIGYPVLRHILNSAGIERFPDAQFEMVRLGIGLYGISSENNDSLATVSTLKSTVIQVKQVPKNETIGYSRKGKAFEDMSIAIVPVGYADGLNRLLSNGRGKLYINGFYVPIVGNICMDMCMVDITGCNIHEGDEVIVFGKEISILDMAKELNTIPYEILTSVSSRVKRVYFQE